MNGGYEEMKKIISLMLALLTVCVLFTGCGAKKDPDAFTVKIKVDGKGSFEFTTDGSEPKIDPSRLTTEADAQNADVLIINCFGLLSSIYHYGEVAYVGGGFGVGIHNVLEAAVWDVPVFFGPNNQRFQEAQGLKAAGGGFDFEAAEAFEHQMDIFLTDAEKLRAAGEKAGKFVQSLAGATEKVLSSVNL